MSRILGLITLLALAGCSQVAGLAVDAFVGAQPSVALDAQVGGDRTNGAVVTRQAGTGNRIETNRVRTERVETIVNNERVPPWIWLLFAAALVLDSPLRWPRQIWAAMRGRPCPD